MALPDRHNAIIIFQRHERAVFADGTQLVWGADQWLPGPAGMTVTVRVSTHEQTSAASAAP